MIFNLAKNNGVLEGTSYAHALRGGNGMYRLASIVKEKMAEIIRQRPVQTAA